MKLRTIVIDDEPIALGKLESYARKVPFLDPVTPFDNSLDALEYLSTHEADLIITDIEMPDLNGMDFAAGLTGNSMVVFTTAYEQYAVESYKVRAVDYLLKPYSFADFQRAANRALELFRSRGPKQESSTPTALFIKTDTRYVKVDPADILYIKGYGEYLQLFISSEAAPLVTLSSFAAIREKLPANFLQVHRSYIVNMENVKLIERQHIYIDRSTSIPVSDSYRAALQQYLSSRSVGAPAKPPKE